jgi:DNA-binding HxlR family transcriptional regulator
MPKTYGQKNCPVARTLDLFGDRWTLLLVRELLLGKTRYQEFMAALPGVSPNLLSARLKTLEKEGLVRREQYVEHPRRMEYRLTEEGKKVKFLIAVLIHWGSRHFGIKKTLVHEKCGKSIDIQYHCPHCDTVVPETEVKVLAKGVGRKKKVGVFGKER